MNKYNKEYFKDLEESNKTELPRNIRNLNLILKYKKEGRLLDVGIGTGLFLQLAKKAQFNVCGIDISEYSISKAKNELKIQAYKQELSKFNPKQKFDVINMRHTIEHVSNPLSDLKKAYSILNKGGIIYISTPNSFSIHAKLFGDDWPHWAHPYHLQFFSNQSLTDLVKSAGFKILETKTEELTIYNSIYIILKRLAIKNKLYPPSKLSLLFDKFLAIIGLGEGLVLIAQKL